MTDWTRRYGCEVASNDREWLVTLVGELDLVAAPLTAAVLGLVAPIAAGVAVDLHGVTFMDSAAAAALVRGDPPVLVRPSAIARSTLERCGVTLDQQPPPAVGAAVRHALVATDVHGRITDWNDAAVGLYGWQAWEAVGRQITTVGICPQGEALAREITSAVYRDGFWDGRFEVLHRTGDLVAAHVRETLIRDHAGRVTGLVRLCAPALASAAA